MVELREGGFYRDRSGKVLAEPAKAITAADGYTFRIGLTRYAPNGMCVAGRRHDVVAEASEPDGREWSAPTTASAQAIADNERTASISVGVYAGFGTFVGNVEFFTSGRALVSAVRLESPHVSPEPLPERTITRTALRRGNEWISIHDALIAAAREELAA